VENSRRDLLEEEWKLFCDGSTITALRIQTFSLPPNNATIFPCTDTQLECALNMYKLSPSCLRRTSSSDLPPTACFTHLSTAPPAQFLLVKPNTPQPDLSCETGTL
jgi:hypothetical protein